MPRRLSPPVVIPDQKNWIPADSCGDRLGDRLFVIEDPGSFFLHLAALSLDDRCRGQAHGASLQVASPSRIRCGSYNYGEAAG